MLQKEAIKPVTLGLLKSLQTDPLPYQFCMDWPVMIGKKDLTWEKVNSAIDKYCQEYIKRL